jgi:hypothetical protein
MAERLGLGLLEPPADWLTRLPYKYTNRKLWYGTVADLKRSSVEQRAFIKPANDKLFERAVYERGSDVPVKWVDPSCPIIVSEVVAFKWEVRLHVLDRKIVTAAEYVLIDTIGQEPEPVIAEAKEWAQDLLADPDLDLPSAVVIDVGLMEEGRGWGVVEANQVYASGMYNEANRDAVLDLVLRAAGPLELVSETDRKYLRNP